MSRVNRRGCLAAAVLLAAADVCIPAFSDDARVCGSPSAFAPETWFHIIGGNASEEGLSADIAAIADAGISGIHFFHGGWSNDELWPGVTNRIPCLSENWVEIVKFAAEECHKRGLKFKVQNCPGWSMSGGPWIAPSNSMRRLVCFEPGNRPAFDSDDDFREIGSVTFPLEDSSDVSVSFPNPHKICHPRSYEPDADVVVMNGLKEVFRARCPRGAWQDVADMTFRVPAFQPDGRTLSYWAESPHYERKELKGSWAEEPRLDMWEAKAGWAYRSFKMSSDARPIRTEGERTLVFGHVNMKRRNGPAPKEATGWECDKMDPRGFEVNFAGYLGLLLKNGVKIDGTLVDSWECGCQTWTWNMEEQFENRAGYALRPWLPSLFGYVLKSEADTEKFLLDWRNVCSRLVEENYYAVIARIAHEHGMSVQYETAFGDVIPGDLLRYWKYADEPMCEFWSPHENVEYVGSFDFKPVLPCVSAAHVYGKRRVSAEALTSLKLTFNENFRDWKEIIDKHLARGVTHIVFHTYTHNPVVGGKPPSTSFGSGIGSPFLREQTWWPYLRHFTKYIERCGAELERGLPAVDILMYLGDDLGYRPSERELLFENRWKYDYLNNDALMTRLDVDDGRLVFPDGMSYRVLWIPKGTFLKPETEAKLADLERNGARIARGDFKPDWPSPTAEALGIDAADLRGWYQRRDGETNVFFVVEKDGSSRFYRVAAGRETMVFDPVSGRECVRSALSAKKRGDAAADVPVAIRPVKDYPVWATSRVYEGAANVPEDAAECILDLGDVRDWATVYVNGRKVADMWCRPYACDIAQHVKGGGSVDIRVEVVSTWYNALVHDAGLPKEDRTTWTLKGPSAEMPYCEADLLGPVRLSATKQHGNTLRRFVQ